EGLEPVLSIVLAPDKVPVLIIEDNPATAFICQNYLHRTESQPIAVSSVEQARKVLGRIQASVIVMDLYLAGQNCSEFLRELRIAPRTKNVPILAVSVMDEARRALSFGANQFLRKPIDQE